MQLWQRFTSQARRIVVTAHDLAKEDGGTLISSAHLCLGLLVQADSAPPQVVPPEVDRETLKERLQELAAETEAGTAEPSFTPEAQRVLLRALKKAKEVGSESVAAEHLVAGLLREAPTVSGILREAGFGETEG